jgi:hypothetical protein
MRLIQYFWISRHYNAWYELGMLYLHQEKFEFSEHHFRMTFRINPKSFVILSYIGTALHFLKVNLLLHLMCLYKLQLQLSFTCVFVSKILKLCYSMISQGSGEGLAVMEKTILADKKNLLPVSKV